MTNRYKIEKAFVDVLERTGLENVRMTCSSDLLAWPLILVEMTGETRDHPRLPANVLVDVHYYTQIPKDKFIDRGHYDGLDKVKEPLMEEGGIYLRLLDVGLNVSSVLNTEETGTEIIENEGGSQARSTITVSLAI